MPVKKGLKSRWETLSRRALKACAHCTWNDWQPISTKCRSKEVMGGMIVEEEVLQSDLSSPCPSASSPNSDPDSGPHEASFFTGVNSIRKAPKMAPKRLDHDASTSLVHNLNSFWNCISFSVQLPTLKDYSLYVITWSFRGRVSLTALQNRAAKSWGSNLARSMEGDEYFLAIRRKYLTIVRDSSRYLTIFFSTEMRYMTNCCKSSFNLNSLCFLPRYERKIRFIWGWDSKSTKKTCTPTCNVKKTVKNTQILAKLTHFEEIGLNGGPRGLNIGNIRRS